MFILCYMGQRFPSTFPVPYYIIFISIYNWILLIESVFFGFFFNLLLFISWSLVINQSKIVAWSLLSSVRTLIFSSRRLYIMVLNIMKRFARRIYIIVHHIMKRSDNRIYMEFFSRVQTSARYRIHYNFRFFVFFFFF